MKISKEQIVAMRSQWLSQASNDIFTRINEFMRQTRMNERDLANFLSLPLDEVRAMLNGNSQNMTLLGFATLLIASGLVINIMPFNEREMTRHMPMDGNRPMPHRDARHMDMGGMPMPKRSAGPKRDANGRFAPKTATTVSDADIRHAVEEEPFYPTPNGEPLQNFDSMKRSELVKLIRTNRWEDEIDLDEADRSQIIAFIESKVSEQNVIADEAPEVVGNASDFAKMIAEELAKNPQLIQSILGGRK